MMRKSTAAAGTALFFLVAPVMVTAGIPWWLTGWRPRHLPGEIPLGVLGALSILAGAGVLIHSFVRFVVEGSGTPAPVAPTEHLVIGGLYRHVRNPMYLAVLAILAGQILLLRQWPLVLYTAAVGIAVAAFTRWYEEPTLRRRHGASYEEYRRAVPGWWPRLRPWSPDEGPASRRG